MENIKEKLSSVPVWVWVVLAVVILILIPRIITYLNKMNAKPEEPESPLEDNEIAEEELILASAM